jgi:thiol-disulfide isomerase/thioredoxin
MKALLALLISSFAVHAAPAPLAYNISQFKLGTYITGPQLTLDNAKGKAVLIDVWGVHCGPCLRSLPDIENISKRLKDKMVVFGAHAQGGPVEAVKAVVAQNKLTYTIVDNLQSPIPSNTIPHVYVFDAAGGMIFSGTPFDPNFSRALQFATKGVTKAPAQRESSLDAFKKANSAKAQ